MSPFRSVKQRKYLWATHPDIAKKWTEEHGSKVVTKKVNRKRRKVRPKPRKLPKEKG